MPSADNKRAHARYSGMVQGVGFRFVTERTASRYDVTGFVKNMPDGTVEIICEGAKTEVQTFLNEINENMRSYISDSRIEWQAARGEFSSFEIRF